MKKKFICPICGFVFEGEQAPERCPQCKQLVEWKVAADDKLNFACEHILGVAKNEQDPIIHDGLRAHFMGEATEVGQYLAMAKRLNTALNLLNSSEKSFGIPKPTSKNVCSPKLELENTNSISLNALKSSTSILFMTPCTKWLATKLVMVKDSKACTIAILRNN